MFIEPFVLFIAAEILVVYIIIASFLFYNGRLHNILKEMLKEMRRNRMLRELLNAKKLAGERSNASKIISKDLMKAIQRGGPDVYTNFVDVKIDDVEEQARELGLSSAPEFNPNDPAQLQIIALRTALLNMEKLFESTKGVPNEQASSELLAVFNKEIISKMSGVAIPVVDTKELNRQKAEIEHLMNRCMLLEKFEEQFYNSQQELKETIEELDNLKTITLDEIPASIEAPQIGDYSDEIYQLKSQKFDMMETINKLKLQLEQSNSSDNPDTYIEQQKQQIDEQARYMKESDVCITLLENELETLGHQLTSEQARLKSLEKQLEQRPKVVTGDEEHNINTESVGKLSTVNKKQKETIEQLKSQLEALRSIEGAAEIAEVQQTQLTQLEQNIQESETCIDILESELEAASENINDLIGSLKSSEALNESGDELEVMLQKFVQDSKEMLKNIAGLEKENQRLVKENKDKMNAESVTD